MRNVKGKFDEGTMVVTFKTGRKKKKVQFYSLLRLAIQFTDRRMRAQKINTLANDRNRNKQAGIF